MGLEGTVLSTVDPFLTFFPTKKERVKETKVGSLDESQSLLSCRSAVGPAPAVSFEWTRGPVAGRRRVRRVGYPNTGSLGSQTFASQIRVETENDRHTGIRSMTERDSDVKE